MRYHHRYYVDRRGHQIISAMEKITACLHAYWVAFKVGGLYPGEVIKGLTLTGGEFQVAWKSPIWLYGVP